MRAILATGHHFPAQVEARVGGPYISDREIDVSNGVSVWQTPKHHVLRSAHYRQARWLKRDTASAQTSHVREGFFCFSEPDERAANHRTRDRRLTCPTTASMCMTPRCVT